MDSFCKILLLETLLPWALGMVPHNRLDLGFFTFLGLVYLQVWKVALEILLGLVLDSYAEMGTGLGPLASWV
jgi:hypothetical protein